MTQTQTAITSLRFVPQSELVVDHKNWTNPRTITGLDEASLADLGKDIKQRGIQVPLIVQKIWSNADRTRFTNLVLEGQRRSLAVHEVMPKDYEVPVVDRTVDPIELTPEAADELMLDMLSVATKRDGLSSFELSEVAERLRKRERKLSDISKAIGRSEGWISKILKARSTSTPKLLLRWRKGEITDEQFKELAEVKEPERQEAAVAEVVKARKSGDLTEARLRSKEVKEGEKQKGKLCLVRGPNGEKCMRTNGHDQADGPCTDGVSTSWRPSGWVDDAPRTVKGPQVDLFKDDPVPVKPAPKPKKPMTARIALEELVSMRDRRPPTHDYVKGIVDGVLYALAEIGPEDFARPWTAYLARIDGSGAKKKPAKSKKKSAKKSAKKAKAKATKKRK